MQFVPRTSDPDLQLLQSPLIASLINALFAQSLTFGGQPLTMIYTVPLSSSMLYRKTVQEIFLYYLLYIIT